VLKIRIITGDDVETLVVIVESVELSIDVVCGIKVVDETMDFDIALELVISVVEEEIPCVGEPFEELDWAND
jgi:hypothetical protein